MQAQRTASEKRRAKRKVNQRFLSAMSDMGINVEQAELALSETGNVGVEVATEWLFSVPEQVLNKHLGGEPSTPTNDVEPAVDDARRYLLCLHGTPRAWLCQHGHFVVQVSNLMQQGLNSRAVAQVHGAKEGTIAGGALYRSWRSAYSGSH